VSRDERKDEQEMVRMFHADAEWERQKRFGRRALLALAFAAAIWYGWLCQEACIADQAGCRAAMSKYDGYPISPPLAISK
jgi:hypothetical protein